MPALTIQEAFELAVQHHNAGRIAEAESLYRQILVHLPEQPDCLYGMGGVLLQTGRAAQAIELLRRAAILKPQDAGYQNALGNALTRVGQFDEAMDAYQKAVTLQPDFAEAHHGLGNVYFVRSAGAQAITAYRRALELRPDFSEAVAALSSALINFGHLEEPIVFCRQALTLWPDMLIFHRLLGWAYRESGRLDEAIDCYRQAISRHNEAQIHSDLLFTLHFHAEYDKKRLFEEHLRFNELHGLPRLVQAPRHDNDATPDRRLRIGYVAHDLGDNPLGRFLLPLVENHDKDRCELLCYCDYPRPDATGNRLRSHGQWRTTAGMSHDEVADLVRRDRIDVLIDLAMHSNNNRLLMFSRKPAPVQVTYLAYCSTTGLEAIDYRLTDRYLDPPDGDDSCYSEKSVRLPGCYWSYAAIADAPGVGPLPATLSGHVTFGCLNEFSKVSRGCLSTWFRILRQIPGSRLTLHAKEGPHRQRAIEQAVHDGVEPERILFAGRRGIRKYLEQYNQIDVALDPFPWNGGATSCDALYMGVPLVTLVGQTAVSRGGVSILSNLGLPELAARDIGQYVQIACDLAGDLPKLAGLRGSLRRRMLESPLMNAPRFARDVEAAYRQMWREWCAKQQRR